MPSVKRSALVTLVAAIGAFACRTAAPVLQPGGTVWLLFVDDLHLDFRRTGYVKGFLKRIANELIRDGDSFAVRSTGPSSLAIDLTSDRLLLEGAIRNTSGAGLTPADTVRIVQSGRPDEVTYRANLALSAALGFLRTREAADGRRAALIYVSHGYDIRLGRIRDQLSALTRQAKKTRVMIFALDPRGLGPPTTPDPRVDPDALAAHLATTRKSLRFIAEQTSSDL